MLKIFLAAGVLAVAISPVRADIMLDPLHGYCGGAGQCIDNNINSPTSNNPPINFGFTVSPGPASGSDLLYDILVPTSEQNATSYTFTGTQSGTTTQLAGEFNTGALDTFIGISASPSNPIGSFGAGGFTSYSVYQFNAGAATLQGPSNPNSSPLENLTTTIPMDSYIVAFLNEGTAANPNWVATAPSGAILEAVPGPILGAGLPGLVAGCLGLIALARRRKMLHA